MCGTRLWILLFFQNWTSQENTGVAFSAVSFELRGGTWSSLWQRFEAPDRSLISVKVIPDIID